MIDDDKQKKVFETGKMDQRALATTSLFKQLAVIVNVERVDECTYYMDRVGELTQKNELNRESTMIDLNDGLMSVRDLMAERAKTLLKLLAPGVTEFEMEDIAGGAAKYIEDRVMNSKDKVAAEARARLEVSVMLLSVVPLIKNNGDTLYNPNKLVGVCGAVWNLIDTAERNPYVFTSR